MGAIFAGSMRYLQTFTESMNKLSNGEAAEGTSTKVKKALFWATHLVGSAIFVGSFGIFAAPFLAGWGLLETGLAFAVAQLCAGAFFNVQGLYFKTAATLQGIKDAWTKK